MLVAVWFLLHEHIEEKYLNLECKTAAAFIHQQLARAGIGREMNSFIYSRKKVELPPSKLPVEVNQWAASQRPIDFP